MERRRLTTDHSVAQLSEGLLLSWTLEAGVRSSWPACQPASVPARVHTEGHQSGAACLPPPTCLASAWERRVLLSG